jgi:hypothetical protein
LLKVLRGADLGVLKERVSALKSLSTKEVEALWKKCGADGSGLVDMTVSDKFGKTYPHLHRNCGGAHLLNMILKGKPKIEAVQLDLEFVEDSLFCEWAYFIDLDEGVMEVYRGFVKGRPGKGRFADLEPSQDKHKPVSERYFPVTLAATFKLSDLPSDKDFLRVVNAVAKDHLSHLRPSEWDKSAPQLTPEWVEKFDDIMHSLPVDQEAQVKLQLLEGTTSLDDDAAARKYAERAEAFVLGYGAVPAAP